MKRDIGWFVAIVLVCFAVSYCVQRLWPPVCSAAAYMAQECK